MGSETRVFWRNVYQLKPGAQWLGFGHLSRELAEENAAYMSSNDPVGRWKITLKEQEPRHDR